MAMEANGFVTWGRGLSAGERRSLVISVPPSDPVVASGPDETVEQVSPGANRMQLPALPVPQQV